MRCVACAPQSVPCIPGYSSNTDDGALQVEELAIGVLRQCDLVWTPASAPADLGADQAGPTGWRHIAGWISVSVLREWFRVSARDGVRKGDRGSIFFQAPDDDRREIAYVSVGAEETLPGDHGIEPDGTVSAGCRERTGDAACAEEEDDIEQQVRVHLWVLNDGGGSSKSLDDASLTCACTSEAWPTAWSMTPIEAQVPLYSSV